MTVSSHRVEEIFNTLMNTPRELRTKLGKAHCGSDTALWREVNSLLKVAENAKGFLSLGAEGVEWITRQSLEPESLRGQRLGAFEIVKVLDSGGMGVVFLAKRVDGHYEQQVAIKMSRFGLGSEGTLQRFYAERQFLAHLQHSNIAQLFDGGTSADGHPYLVMEYIQGETIDNHCSCKQLSIKQILLLMQQVCNAVHYAHQNLLIHCDIKPANILVTSSGIPKLLDFGIATLLQSTHFPLAGSQTDNHISAVESSAAPFTPEFAAPEQLRVEPVTTAADVYSLGVVIYKLLSGKLPYKINGDCLQDIAETVSNTTIPAPSSAAPPAIQRQLRGDLDSLVLKAMHKDPGQRYSSVQELADDIDRYLAGHPLKASKSTWLYRTGKFIGRHRMGVGLGTIAAASLLAGSVISTWQWQIAQDKQVEAERRSQDVHELTSMVVFDIPKSISELPGSTPLRERMIRKGVAYLDTLEKTRADSPKLLNDLALAYVELARLQGNPMTSNLGDPELALNNFQKALNIQKQLLNNNPNDLKLSVNLATTYMFKGALHGASLGDLNHARQLTEQCLSLVKPFVPTGNPQVLKRSIACSTVAAHWLTLAGQASLAAQHLRDAEEVYESLPSNHPFARSMAGYRLWARIHEEWAEIATRKGQYQHALEHERERLEVTLTQLQSHEFIDRFVGTAYHGLAARLAAVERFVEAQEAFSLAATHWTKWQSDHPLDVSAAQALIVIQGELADLQWKVASAEIEPAKRAQAVETACSTYSDSVRNLDFLPDKQTSFPTRYAWSPNPDTIVEHFENRC